MIKENIDGVNMLDAKKPICKKAFHPSFLFDSIKNVSFLILFENTMNVCYDLIQSRCFFELTPYVRENLVQTQYYLNIPCMSAKIIFSLDIFKTYLVRLWKSFTISIFFLIYRVSRIGSNTSRCLHLICYNQNCSEMNTSRFIFRILKVNFF